MACEPFDCKDCRKRHTRCSGHAVLCRYCGWSGGNHVVNATCSKCERKRAVIRRPCMKWPRKGLPNCQKHGGEAPQVIAAAAEREAAAVLIRTVEAFGGRKDIEPTVAIREEIARTAYNLDRHEWFIATLEAETTTDTRSELKRLGTIRFHEGKWEQERAWLLKISVEAVKLGIEERQMLVEEQHGHAFAQLVRAVVGDPELGFDVATQRKFAVVAGKHLRALPTG